jgi:heme/copper-type cytochrome/quinol oxidase subunit 2
MRKAVAAAALLFAIVLPVAAYGCPVCFGDPSSSLTKGASNGMLFLLVIVGLVQAAFVALFWTFWRRSKELQRRKDSFHVVDGGNAHA